MIDPQTAYDLEIGWSLGRIEWLIGVAQSAYDRFGADDMDKWDLNGPLLSAIKIARVALLDMQLEQYPGMSAEADRSIAALANAIAYRLGEESRAAWDTELLVALATKVIKP
jgi:hypothetical protein